MCYTLIVLTGVLWLSPVLCGDPVVHTHAGAVQGRAVYSRDPRDPPAFVFLGIPYAAPPVQEFRFRPPQRVKPWQGVRDATKHGPICPQDPNIIPDDLFNMQISPSLDQSENCLTLDIYTAHAYNERNSAVMVFIHGGGLIYGSSAPYEAQAYSIKRDIVVVVIQYRLGPLGFLSTGDGVIGGNMGLLDQVAALEWVRENIHEFGGDPRRVTLFGESAGSHSVNFHVISPRSRGLFHRVIYQSGSLASPPSSMDYRKTARSLADKLALDKGCPIDQSAAMAICLRALPVDAFTVSLPPGLKKSVWRPVIDGRTIPAHPSTIMKAGDFNAEMAVLAGVCHTEGYFIVKKRVLDLQKKLTIEMVKQNTIDFFKVELPNVAHRVSDLVSAAFEVYITAPVNTDGLKKICAQMFGDFYLAFPTYMTARAHREHGSPAYFYEFAHRVSSSSHPAFILADHTDDLMLTFGAMFNNHSQFMDLQKAFDAKDAELSKVMMNYWANFAKTGDPNGPGLPHWAKFDDSDSYLKLQFLPEMKDKLNHDRFTFWRTIAPRILYGHDEL